MALAAHRAHHSIAALLRLIEVTLVHAEAFDVGKIGNTAPLERRLYLRVGEHELGDSLVVARGPHVVLPRRVAPVDDRPGSQIDLHFVARTFLDQVHGGLAAKRLPGAPGEHFRLGRLVQSDVGDDHIFGGMARGP